MKTFTVPKDIQLHDRTNPALKGELVTFAKIAIVRWANVPEAVTDMASLRRWTKVVDQLGEAQAGGNIALEDQDHATLAKIVAADIAKVPPLVAMQLEPFYTAVLDAKEPTRPIALTEQAS